jgi:hypothetical protein
MVTQRQRIVETHWWQMNAANQEPPCASGSLEKD